MFRLYIRGHHQAEYRTSNKNITKLQYNKLCRKIVLNKNTVEYSLVNLYWIRQQQKCNTVCVTCQWSYVRHLKETFAVLCNLFWFILEFLPIFLFSFILFYFILFYFILCYFILFRVILFNFILFNFVLFYFISFYFISFYFISFCFILFYFILFRVILLYFILFYFISFYFILFYFILFYFISFHFTLFYFISFYFILLILLGFLVLVLSRHMGMPQWCEGCVLLQSLHQN